MTQHSHINVNGFIIANDVSQKSDFACHCLDEVDLRVFTEGVLVVLPQNILFYVPG